MYHKAVMLEECIDALNIKSNGIYVDGTFGGGGHSKAILNSLGSEGKLYGFDQDIDAQTNAIDDTRFTFIHANFRHLKRYLKLHQETSIDGILLDLGISSYQIDTAEKGFSTRFEGPLDMRMDKDIPISARDIVNNYSTEELQDIFSQYGEVRNAKTLAETIDRERSISAIETTNQLTNILSHLSHGNPNKYYAQVFQALRIAVNEELKSLKEVLAQCGEILGQKGRLVVLTYHSLEDRLVKYYVKTGNFDGNPTKDQFGNLIRPMQWVNRKPIYANEEEIKANPRSRSAKLRIAEKI